MLVLTRKVDERLMIGDDIEIMVVDVEGDQVKLGIEAPQDIPIHRQEVYDEIQRENVAAAQTSGEEIESAAEFLDTESEMDADANEDSDS